jgi:hypothetical protein
MTPVGGKRKGGIKVKDIRAGGLGVHAATYSLDGYTRDYDTQAIIPGCAVHLFKTSDDSEVSQTVSSSVGYFNFTGLPDDTTEYYLVAYLTGTPDVAGTTLNTLKAA